MSHALQKDVYIIFNVSILWIKKRKNLSGWDISLSQ